MQNLPKKSVGYLLFEIAYPYYGKTMRGDAIVAIMIAQPVAISKKQLEMEM